MGAEDGVAVEAPLGLSISFVGEGSLGMTAGLCTACEDRRWRMGPCRMQLNGFSSLLEPALIRPGGVTGTVMYGLLFRQIMTPPATEALSLHIGNRAAAHLKSC